MKLDKELVLELLQQDLTASHLLKILKDSLNNPGKMQEKQNQIFNIIEPLAVKNTYKHTSSYIANY